MFTRASTVLFAFIIGVPFSFGFLAPEAEAITTTPICNSAVTCQAAGLNLLAATLRRPDDDSLGRAHIGIFVMHSSSNYVNNNACSQLATRGYTTLCANSEFSGQPDGYYGYEQHAPGIKSGID